MSNGEIYQFSMSMYDFFNSLVNNEIFRNEIIQIFKKSKFENVYWEFPPYYKTTTQSKAQFVFMSTSSFGKADSENFKEHLSNRETGEIVVFNNLSGDTKLISIASKNNNDMFCHIMQFMKNAPSEYKHNLLIKIGCEMLKYSNSTSPIYLSTHGHGVSWLHIRICNRPKYYTYKEYTK